jgi:hypothetical protein
MQIEARYAGITAPAPAPSRPAACYDAGHKQGKLLGSMRIVVRVAGDRRVRLAVIVAVGLALGACSKCDVPFWHHDAPATPQSCHDDAAAK